MFNNTANMIAYYRVSTQQQGKSGLGLDAQRAAVQRFADSEAFTIAQEFIEIETGKGADALDKRPQLAAALRAARKLKAPVVVARRPPVSRGPFCIKWSGAWRCTWLTVTGFEAN